METMMDGECWKNEKNYTIKLLYLYEKINQSIEQTKKEHELLKIDDNLIFLFVSVLWWRSQN